MTGIRGINKPPNRRRKQMEVKKMKEEKNLNAVEMTDDEILEMLSRIFRVGVTESGSRIG